MLPLLGSMGASWMSMSSSSGCSQSGETDVFYNKQSASYRIFMFQNLFIKLLAEMERVRIRRIGRAKMEILHNTLALQVEGHNASHFSTVESRLIRWTAKRNVTSQYSVQIDLN